MSLAGRCVARVASALNGGLRILSEATATGLYRSRAVPAGYPEVGEGPGTHFDDWMLGWTGDWLVSQLLIMNDAALFATDVGAMRVGTCLGTGYRAGH